MNGGQQHAHARNGKTSPPSECPDDRPDQPAGAPQITESSHLAAGEVGPEFGHREHPDGTHGEMSVADSQLGQAVRAETPPPDPGAQLRAAREAHGLTIEDIARTTKIGKSVLAALENNQVEKLPAAIFTRGFLKAYASEVGLDPDETADLYLALLVPETLVVDGETARLKVALPAERTEVLAYDDDTTRFLAVKQAGRFGWLVTLASVIGLAVYLWSFTWERGSAEHTQAANQPAATDAAQASATPQPGPDATPAAAQAIETPAGPLQFQLTPQGPCWLAVSADGSPVFARLLKPGEQETVQANDELVLRVGDPGALSFSINGKPGRALGPAGQPVSVRITKDNFRDFLSS
jgi:cytoskeletal protein RodZ